MVRPPDHPVTRVTLLFHDVKIFSRSLTTEALYFLGSGIPTGALKSCLLLAGRALPLVQVKKIKIGLPETTYVGDLFANIGLAQKQQNRLLLTRAGILFFSRDPQRHFPEVYVTSPFMSMKPGPRAWIVWTPRGLWRNR
jgi:hypothetical protein